MLSVAYLDKSSKLSLITYRWVHVLKLYFRLFAECVSLFILNPLITVSYEVTFLTISHNFLQNVYFRGTRVTLHNGVLNVDKELMVLCVALKFFYQFLSVLFRSYRNYSYILLQVNVSITHGIIDVAITSNRI